MKNISIVMICLFLLFSAVNLEASKPIRKNSSTSETDYSIDSSVINNAQEQQILQNLNQFDGYFTENRGQVGNDYVRYYIQDRSVWITDDGVWFELREELSINNQQSSVYSPESRLMTDDWRPTTIDYKRVVLKQEFIGANQVRPIGRECLTWNNNYFYGNDSSKWCTNVPNYQEIIYENIYDKIDLRYYSSEKGLKYEFIVHPGGEPNDIRMKYEGAQELKIDTSGNLEIKTQLINMVDSDLFIYQNSINDKKVIKGKFKLFAPSAYGFEIIGKYDKNKAIIIDPLVYSTYIGGSDKEGNWDDDDDIAVDTAGNAYVTGVTESSDFPTTPGANDTTHNGGMDCFVLKLNPIGSALIYSTYIGGSGAGGEEGNGIAVDTAGSAYVTGTTDSSDFPTTSGAYDTTHNKDFDGFVLKLNPTGTSLLYSTYIGGGSHNDFGGSIAVDTAGNAYVTGVTYSSDFPTTSGAYDPSDNGASDVFVLKLNPKGATLIYSTYIGGSTGVPFAWEVSTDIAIDTAGNAYVTGYTWSSDFPTTPGAYDTTHNGGANDGFVLKLNSTGSALSYSTYIGGSTGEEGGRGIAVDTTGSVYVTGDTPSSDFPTTPGAYDTTHNGGKDGFVLKLNSNGSALIYSTYLGGSDYDEGKDIVVDTAGSAYVTGCTRSSNFPTTLDAYNTAHSGVDDVFMLKLNSTGSGLSYSTYIGGSNNESGNSITVDTTGSVYVTGITRSSNFPTTPGANDTTLNGDRDGFVLKIGTPFSPLFLSSTNVVPNSGNTSTEFNFTVKYYHLNNSSPTGVKVFIDENEHLMLEVDHSDNNYTNGKDYFFKIKNLDIGTHTYKFWASNGTKTISTYLRNYPKVLNTPPTIITQDNLTAIEDTYYEVSYEFEDLDVDNVGQSCFWEFYTNANWLSFISNPPLLYGTPTNDDVGEYWVNIIIDDTNDTDETNFTLTVIDVNDKPKIVTQNVEEIYEDEFYEVEYSASDIDSPIENQIWSLETNTSLWLNLNTNSGVLNGTPTNYDVGIYWVNVSVDDNEGGTDFTNFTLTVVNVNDPPFIITNDLTIIRLGDFYEMDYIAADIDSPASDLIWYLETNASWLSLNSSTGVLNGTPRFNDIGWYNVNVSVDDGNGGLDWHEFELSVLPRLRNDPPFITTSDVELAQVDQLYEVDYNATDDHTPVEQLLWYLETNASWLSIDIFTGVISGTPSENHIGTFWVNISVTDVESKWAFHNFSLIVKGPPPVKDLPPELSNPKMEPESGNTETEFTFSIHYYDVESQAPSYVRLVTDVGTYDMEFSSGKVANGTYQCTINLPEGEHKYHFTASDGSNKVNTERFFTTNIQEDKQASKDENSTGIIVAIIILIIIVLIILFLFLRKRNKQKEEAKKELTPILPTPVAGISPYPTTTFPAQQIEQPPTDITPTIIPTVPEQHPNELYQEHPQRLVESEPSNLVSTEIKVQPKNETKLE